MPKKKAAKNSGTQSLLVELLTEELPPKTLRKLGEAFADLLKQELGNCDLLEPTSIATAFASPRRLAAHITDIRSIAPTKRMRKKLMPATIAFEANGQRSDALKKRLEKEGYASFVDGPAASLIREKEGATEYIYLDYEEGGMSLAFNLDFSIKTTIAKLPIPKVMSYQLDDSATTVQFVRPARGLIALHGDKVVDVSVLGLEAGRVTHGHRFHGVKNIEVKTADAYEEALAANGEVIASFDERRSEIERQLASHAQKLQSHFSSEPPRLSPQEEFNGLPELNALVDEVTALVEYPAVYVGEFDREFLAMPRECLILTMRQNQKYFPLFDGSGKLTNKFLFVSNMHPADARQIIHGNERVLRARLADARFFYEQDRKIKLEDRVEQLKNVVYHNKLGSQYERVLRIQKLAVDIARQTNVSPELALRAAYLSKADLLTEMVGEFPELQGIMGREYAFQEGESNIATIIYEHYLPRFAGDDLPNSAGSISVALADKLDALVGIYGIGLIPTGDKDPFGLRRHALGVVRILIERAPMLPSLDIKELLQSAQSNFPANVLTENVVRELYGFVLERLKSYLRERNYSPDEIDAVLALNPTRFDQVLPRLDAIKKFRALPEGMALSAANKRIRNILRQAGGKIDGIVKSDLLTEEAEKKLAQLVGSASDDLAPMIARHDYSAALKRLASLRPTVDEFFDKVMVMADDSAVRANRLALLNNLSNLFLHVADVSRLQG